MATFEVLRINVCITSSNLEDEVQTGDTKVRAALYNPDASKVCFVLNVVLSVSSIQEL